MQNLFYMPIILMLVFGILLVLFFIKLKESKSRREVMSTENAALKVVTATLFAALCLQPFLDSVYQHYILDVYI